MNRFFYPSRSLSMKLLLLTILFVMVIEVLVYVPSIALFRKSFLEERIAAGQIAALSLMEAPNNMFSEDLRGTLLETAGVMAVVLTLEDRRLLLSDTMPESLVAQYDLREGGILKLIPDALMTLTRGGQGVIQVTDDTVNGTGRQIAIVLDEAMLFDAMSTYSRNVLALSLLISIVTGGLVYWTLNMQLVRPMRRVTSAITRFGANPDDPLIKITQSRRTDEIGVAERELSRMQDDLRQALQQRRRLANLGEAVSKINHDLRNILATAQIASESLAMIEDPRLRRQSDRIVRAVDRAIALCERTLRFGRADEPAPTKTLFSLRALVDEVGQTLEFDGVRTRLVNEVPAGLEVCADREQMFRVLINLGRNAIQALAQRTAESPGLVTVRAVEGKGRWVNIDLIDNGPGMPARIQERLFVPFGGSTSAGGTGLGLAIVAELVKAHGGDIELVSSGPGGTSFRISLPPDEPAEMLEKAV